MGTKFANAIRTSIFGERVGYISIRKVGIDAPSRWCMDVYSSGSRYVRVVTCSLDWF